MLVFNFKNYLSASFYNIKKYLDPINSLDSEIKDLVFVAPNVVSLGIALHMYPNINFISQNVSFVSDQKSTGHIHVDVLLDAGVKYSIVNHSENRVSISESTLDFLCNLQSKGMRFFICCESVEEAIFFLKINPFAIVYEHRDLIGSNISVTTKMDDVKNFIHIFQNNSVITKPLIGAGISNKKDIMDSLLLGASGVFVASAYVNSVDPYEKLLEFISPFQDLLRQKKLN